MDFSRRGFFGLSLAGLIGQKKETSFSLYVLADDKHLYKCKVCKIQQEDEILKFINEIKDAQRFIDRKCLQRLILVSPNQVVIGNVEMNLPMNDNIASLCLNFNLNFGGRKVPNSQVWLTFAEETSPWGNFSEFSKGYTIHN